jgi:hypothetical protein
MMGIRSQTMKTALAVAIVGTLALPAVATAQDQVKVSDAGQFVRIGQNDQGYVVLGYETANYSINNKWMLLEVSMTTVNKHDATVTRSDIAVKTPDGTIIPMAPQEAFSKGYGDLRSLEARANVQHKSLNYLPKMATRPCTMSFFSSTSGGPAQSIAYDQFSLTPQSACVGRLYFQVPNGIQYGEYKLFVKFPSEVEVPFTIMTKEQAKEWEKKWKEERKEAKEQKK